MPAVGYVATGQPVRQRDGIAYVGPGECSAATIEAFIAGGYRRIVFTSGEHALDRPLSLNPLAPNVELRGEGSQNTILRLAWPSSGQPDDPANALIRARPTPLGYVSTLASTAVVDADVISLALLPGLTTGMCLRIIGHNDGAQEQQLISSGAQITLTEIVQLHDATGKLAWPLMQQHATHNGGEGTPCSVGAIAPVRNLLISGLTLDGTGQSLAVGLLLDGVVGAVLDDVTCRGFSRAGIEPRGGTRDMRFRRVRGEGGINSLVLSSSAMAGLWTEIECAPSGDRTNPIGIPRAILNFKDRCVAINVSSFLLQRGSIGISAWGGTHLSFQNGIVRDIDCSDLITRNPDYAGLKFGCGIDLGASPIPINENGYNFRVSDVILTNCRHNQAPDAVSTVWWHDNTKGGSRNIAISNPGPITLNGRTMSGYREQDVDGTTDGLSVSGCEYGYYHSGVNATMADDVYISGNAGSGASASIGFFLDIPGGTWGPKIARLRIENVANPILFGPAALATPDYSFGIDLVIINSQEQTGCVVALSTLGTSSSFGYLAELYSDPMTGARCVRASTAPNRNGCAIASGSVASSQLLMVCPLPSSRAHVMCDAQPVQVDEWLVQSNVAGLATVDNTPADPATVIGRALSAKGAGEGLVMVGPR